MIRARLVGTVWAAHKAAALEGRKLVLAAETQEGKPTGRVVVAIDTLDSDMGSDVVVAFGSGARSAVAPGEGRATLADAAVVQRVEGSTCS